MTNPLKAPESPGRLSARRGALAALALAMLLSSLGTSIANVGLPTIAGVFGVGLQEVQWVVLAYLLAATAAVLPAGRLGDLFGRKRLLSIGLVVFMAAAVLAGLAQTFWLLVAARVIQGGGAAIMMAMSMALISGIGEVGRTGSAMGLLGASSAIGTAAGPALGGLLIVWAGWPSVFLIALPLGALALALVRSQLPESASKAKSGKFGSDAVGTVLLVATLGAFALALTVGRGSFGWTNLALLGAAAAGLSLFLWSQHVVDVPLLEPATISSPVLGAGLAMSVLVSTVLMATLVVGPFYLEQVLSLDVSAVGLVLSIGPIAVAFSGVPAGRAVEHFGPRAMTLAGLAAVLVGSALLASVPATFGLLAYVAPILVLTVGYGLFQTANNLSVMTGAKPGEQGVVSGLLNLSRNFGLIAGAAGMAAVFGRAVGTPQLAHASRETVAAAMRATFGVASALILLALVLAVARSSLDKGRNHVA